MLRVPEGKELANSSLVGLQLVVSVIRDGLESSFGRERWCMLCVWGLSCFSLCCVLVLCSGHGLVQCYDGCSLFPESRAAYRVETFGLAISG